MKKFLLAIVLFLIASGGASYTPNNNNKIDNDSKTRGGALYSSMSPALFDKRDIESTEGALFRAGPPDAPGDRPNDGEGIGQETPLSDGLFILLLCSIQYGIVKLKTKRRKN